MLKEFCKQEIYYILRDNELYKKDFTLDKLPPILGEKIKTTDQ